VTVVEQHSSNVGGISKTVSYNGFTFDIGGHRFFEIRRNIEYFG
jgi:protoporphyrinogen oxidase